MCFVRSKIFRTIQRLMILRLTNLLHGLVYTQLFWVYYDKFEQVRKAYTMNASSELIFWIKAFVL